MIMGARIPGFPRWQPAFSLLPKAVVIPHFDELPPFFIKTVRYFIHREWTIVGIERDTALVALDGKASVIGSGNVIVWNRNKRSPYQDRQQLSDLDLASIL
jgi:cyanophycinase-like exopeptidase